MELIEGYKAQSLIPLLRGWDKTGCEGKIQILFGPTFENSTMVRQTTLIPHMREAILD